MRKCLLALHKYSLCKYSQVLRTRKTCEYGEQAVHDLPSIRWTVRSLLSKSYFSLKWSLPMLAPVLFFTPRNSGPSCFWYKSGCRAPNGLVGGMDDPLSWLCPRGGINRGDKQRPRAAPRGEIGAGELQAELWEPPKK